MADLFEIGIKVDMKQLQSANRELDKLGSNLTRVTGTAANTTKTTQKNTTATSQMAQANQFASRKINEVGMATQQAGYQVGDFLVQIQSGTNAFVAFGQQATQLVGILPMFASKLGVSVGTLINVSAVLGIAIPLATALGAAFMRTRQEAEDTSDSLDSLVGSLNASASAARISLKPIEDLREEYGRFAEAVQRASQLRAQAELSEAMSNLDSASEQARTGLQGFNSALAGYSKRVSELNTVTSVLGERTVTNASAFDEAEKAVDKARQTVVESANAIGLSVGEASKLDIALRNLAKAEGMDGIAIAAKESLDMLNGMFGTTENMPTEIAKIVIEMEKVLKAAAAGTVAFEDTADATDGITRGLSKAVSEAIILRDTLASVGRAALSRQDQISVLRSQITAAQTGASVPAAKARTETAIELGRGGATVDQIAREAQIAGQQEATIETLENQLSNLLNPPRTQGGGGGAGADPADSLRKSVDSLIASYDEQYAKTLKIAEATKTLADAQTLGLIPANMSADQILKDYIASLEKADDTMSQFVNDTASQMSDAFMSIVDGSKSASDAFEDMARAILKQAFELAVINPLINSIFGGATGFTKLPTMFADGAAFNGGRVVPFAEGGVVSSPTMFPMAGNQTGLMGEAGPEAIMPLKRGKGGKLGVVAEGASQPVVIHQNFNFSANGDDSVKRIIAQEAPRIANLTQKQIMDQRRRGGAMKATFG